MYPGPADPDLGTFVRQMELALRTRGHELELAVLDRRGGGKLRYLELAKRVRAAAKPDVVYAHFLVPAGLIASRVDAPLVVTAHGRDVRNVGTIPGVAALTRRVVNRASAVVAVSDYLRRELEAKVPGARGKTQVIDMRRRPRAFQPAQVTERHLASPAFLCVGALTERKNVVRLADAFARLGEGSLTFVGDGPLRPQLERRERVQVVGRVPHDEIPAWIARADVVCQPSLIEPLGQSLLEGMACGRSVVATRIGGPPEFVTPEAASSSIRLTSTTWSERSGWRLRCRVPTRPRAPRRPSTTSSFRRRRSRRFWKQPFEIGQPELDQRPHLLLEPSLARRLQRLLEALPNLRRVDALLQPVVAGEEQLLDALACLVSSHFRLARLPVGRRSSSLGYACVVLQVLAVFHVLVSMALIGLILMHSGRDAGLGGMGFTPQSQGGTHIVERNLTRVTIAVALIFTINTVVLFRML